MRAAVAALVLAAGAALLASSRPWLHVAADRPAPFGPVTIDVTGRQLFGALFLLSVLPILGGALVFLTRGVGRQLAGALVGVLGVGLAIPGLRGLGEPSRARVREVVGQHVASTATNLETTVVTGWAVTVVAAAVVVLAVGGLIAARGRSWHTGGLAGRYEAPAQAAAADDVWHALDRGDDPTLNGQ